MDDIWGIVVFLIFLALSFLTRAMRNARPTGNDEKGGAPQRQQWPGPVAGPTMPGYPRRAWSGAPMPSQVREFSQQQREKEIVLEEDDPEGVSMEATPEMVAPEPQFHSLSAEHRRPVEESRADEVVPTGSDTRRSWAASLTSGSGLAQAVVMAEVLGKPKARQRRMQM